MDKFNRFLLQTFRIFAIHIWINFKKDINTGAALLLPAHFSTKLTRWIYTTRKWCCSYNASEYIFSNVSARTVYAH